MQDFINGTNEVVIIPELAEAEIGALILQIEAYRIPDLYQINYASSGRNIAITNELRKYPTGTSTFVQAPADLQAQFNAKVGL
jgi:hypothetical protein